MKKYLYATKNTIGGFFNNPFVSDLAPIEYVDSLKQAFYGIDRKVLESYSELDCYIIGVFDNVSCELVPGNEFVCHIGEEAKQVIKLRFGE